MLALIAPRGGRSRRPTADLDAITVVAEMGDAVVPAAPTSGEREPASLLMMRGEAGWRLREVFD